MITKEEAEKLVRDGMGEREFSLDVLTSTVGPIAVVKHKGRVFSIQFRADEPALGALLLESLVEAYDKQDWTVST